MPEFIAYPENADLAVPTIASPTETMTLGVQVWDADASDFLWQAVPFTGALPNLGICKRPFIVANGVKDTDWFEAHL